jgi:hypothetical protein
MRRWTTWVTAPLTAVILVLAVAAAASADATPAADVTGTWVLHTNACPFPGECPMTVSLVQTGSTITGSASGAPIRGATGESRIKFIVLEGPQEDDFTVTGIVSADGRTIRGRLESGLGGTGALYAVRTSG